MSEFINDIGPDRRQVHNVFNLGNGIYSALWGYDSDTMTTLELNPNVTLAPKPGKANEARNLWKKSGRLLITERIWLPTYRVLAVRVKVKVLSNVWWPIVIEGNDLAEKLLALWLNSTYGILLLFSIAEFTRGPWIDIKKAKLRSLPVVDLTKLDKEKIGTLVTLYNQISTSHFQQLPQEFANPKVRAKIDEAWNNVLDLDIDLSEIYELLAKDPMITGQPLI